MEGKMKKRILYFDIAKGIAILTVIIGHLGGLPDIVGRFIFSFHMPLFFLVSGYFMKPMNVQEIFRKRGKELLIPYAITSLAVIVLASCKDMIQRKSVSEILTTCTQWLWAAFYGSGNNYTDPIYIKQIGAIWFLLAMFFAFLIVNWALKYKNPPVLVLLMVFVGYYSSQIFWLPFSVQAGMVASGFVYLGFLARKYDIVEKIKTIPFIFFICIFIWIVGLASGCGRLYLVRNYFGLGIWEVAVSVCATSVILQVSYYIEKNMGAVRRGLAWLGQNSLYILCLHLIELNVLPWGMMKEYLKDTHGIVWYFVIATILKVIWAVMGVYIFLYIKKKITSAKYVSKMNMVGVEKNGRIDWIDAAKGLAIILMVLAHLPINSTIRTVIFSWHMPIFMLLSGYLFKNRELRITLKNKIKGLILPYLVVEVFALFIAVWRMGFYGDFMIANVLEIVKAQLMSTVLGISYASTIFTDVKSVGPIWFVPCLFVTNMIMAVVIKISKDKEWETFLFVVGSTLLGFFVGKYVAYLPHSIDVAMVSTSFFYVGHVVKKYEILQKLKKFNIWAIIISIWLIAIYTGGIELAVRSYPFFPLCILGGIAGSLAVIELCRYLVLVGPVEDILCFCGKYSIWILSIHRLEMSYCPWEKIIMNVDVHIYFLLRIMLILSLVIVGLFIRSYGQTFKKTDVL